MACHNAKKARGYINSKQQHNPIKKKQETENKRIKLTTKHK